MIKFNVTKEFEDFRLDKYIKEQNDDILYSRSLIDKLIIEKKVSVNSKICVKKSCLVKAGDLISVLVDGDLVHPNYVLEKENIPLKILFEDEFLAIIDKPADLAVHPGAGNRTGTLVNGLLYHFGENLSAFCSEVDEADLSPSKEADWAEHSKEGGISSRPGIVHRLDKDTSGLIIIAKDNKTHFEMSQLFMNRDVDKSYLCLCLGVPEPLNGMIDKPIGRHKTDRKKMAVIDDGKDAVTHYQTLIDMEYFSLLQMKLQTGRTHQIRVHLESIYHPVIGDITYNSLKRTLGSCPLNKQTAIKMFLGKHLQRQALHAWKLKFMHPMTQKEVFVEAEIPDDMAKAIEFFKKMFNYYEVGNKQ